MKNSTYQFLDAAEAHKLVPHHFDAGEDLSEDYSCYLVEILADGTSKVRCRDNGEPEDANFGRDLAAVVDIVQELQDERDALAKQLLESA